MSYEEALERTDPARYGTVEKGSAREQEATNRVVDFFSVLSEENIRAKVRHVYADDAYLNDTLKEVNGIDAIEAYLIESARAVEECTVRFTDVAESAGNYYFRWMMNIRFKNLKKGRVCRSIGMSHIRFNEDGKVVLHQDYWDSASGLFEHVPIVGSLIRTVRAGL